MSDTATTTTAGTTTTGTTTTTTAAPWYEGKLDQELIGHIDNKGWKKDDVTDVAINAVKQARELQKHFGVPPEQLIKLPAKTDDEAGWKAVRERLGAPKEAKDYDLSGVKHADGKDVDTALADAMRAAMLKAGTSKDAAPEIVKAAIKHLDDQAAARTNETRARIVAETAELHKEWGNNKDVNLLTAMQGAARAVGEGGDAKALVAAMQDAIGYKATMEFFRKIGAGTSEDTFLEGGSGGHPTTRAGATARLAELQADKAWSERFLKGDATAKREFNDLMTQIHGAAA